MTPDDRSGAHYICAHCGGAFVSQRPPGEAEAEAEAQFGRGVMQTTDMAILCDECYRAFMVWFERMAGDGTGAQ